MGKLSWRCAEEVSVNAKYEQPVGEPKYGD